MKTFQNFTEDYKVDFKVSLSNDMAETKKLLKRELGLSETDIKHISKNKISILVDRALEANYAKISNILVPLGWKANRSEDTGEEEQEAPSFTSEKMTVYVQKRIIKKKTSGIDNETALMKHINMAIQENLGQPINIVFLDGKREKTYIEVEKCIHVGSSSAGRKKADVMLVSNGKKVPISIKKENASSWESADSYWGKTAAKFIKHLLKSGKVKMEMQSGGHFKINPTLAIKANPQEAIDVVFGSDILAGNGCVLERTFRDSDFDFDNGKSTLVVNVSKIYHKPAHLVGDDAPWFEIRNDSSRESVNVGYDGIRVWAIMGGNIYSNTLRVNRGLIE